MEYCSACRCYVEVRYTEMKQITTVHCADCGIFIRSYSATHVDSIKDLKGQALWDTWESGKRD